MSMKDDLELLRKLKKEETKNPDYKPSQGSAVEYIILVIVGLVVFLVASWCAAGM